MSGLNEADQFLLDGIRQGSADAWTQLVDRYGGRLRAFARGKLKGHADAEDLVQETFIAFLQSLETFREQSSLETYLFAILRRKILNVYRGRARSVCLLQDTYVSDSSEGGTDAAERLPAPDLTASSYARREEDHDAQRHALAAALTAIIREYQDAQNFRDLSVIEMLFYCQLRNKDIAHVASVSENHVAILKHRALKRIQDQLARLPALQGPATEPSDALLSYIWQEYRPSCLKRNTIGAYLLGTLDEEWQGYVKFHLETLGCTFCQANYDDLQQETAEDADQGLRDRILESTVGFLKRDR
jgi:RNA polymerase sigma factor (sigma-70 family)